MEKIKVNVTHNRCTDNYYVTCHGGQYNLCFFQKSKVSDDGWYFRDNLTRSVRFISCRPGEAFPLEFLINLIKASWFFEFGFKDFPEIEFTKAAQKLLKIQQ